MKIGSLTLIPMMLFGILLFSASSFSQDRSEQTQITRSDYISMDKQVSILEFRVKELEKNSDKIDALKDDILSNKAEIQWLHTIVFSWYGFITLIVSIITIVIGIFTYNKTKNMAEEKCSKWLKDHEKEILENIEVQANTWLTTNKNEVIQHIKDTLSIEFINSLNREDGKELIRQVIREEISQISNASTSPKNAHSQNNRQDFEQHSIESEDLIIEDSMPAIQDSFKTITTNENNEEREIVELFEKAINSHGTERISAYSKLIDQFKNSKNDKTLIRVAIAYVNLANELIYNNQRSEAIQFLSEAIQKFKKYDNQDIKLQLAKMEFFHNALIQNS
ncbi:unnamed protein product [Commensalibacter communis]|nr:unnamed protein product [Commensalibacter communis]CAI3946646.1 unnamed protein product [Commensalibacter communis]